MSTQFQLQSVLWFDGGWIRHSHIGHNTSLSLHTQMLLVKHTSSWVFIQTTAKLFILDGCYKGHNFLPRVVYGSNQKPHLKVWLIMLNSFLFYLFIFTDLSSKFLWKSSTVLTFGNFSANFAIKHSWSFIWRSQNKITKKPEELSVQAGLGETRDEFVNQSISDSRLEAGSEPWQPSGPIPLSLVLIWFLFKSDQLSH